MDETVSDTCVQVTKDVKELFARCLYDIMKKKNILDPTTHQYLSDVLTQYVQWDDDEFTPSIHTRMTDPFVFQLDDAGKKYCLDNTLRYKRFKVIGDTLLLAVGYWPESIFSTATRERPSLEYYAHTGQQAYGKAARAANNTRASSDRVNTMNKMANMFIPHVGVLYETRHTLGDVPVKDLKLLFSMSEFLGDDTALKHYLIAPQLRKNMQ